MVNRLDREKTVHLLNPRTATMEDLAAFFRNLTGREPDLKKLAQAEKVLKEIQRKLNEPDSIP
jgi:hypothetical protein